MSTNLPFPMSSRMSIFFENPCHRFVTTDADFAWIESKRMLLFGGISQFTKKYRTNIGFNVRLHASWFLKLFESCFASLALTRLDCRDCLRQLSLVHIWQDVAAHSPANSTCLQINQSHYSGPFEKVDLIVFLDAARLFANLQLSIKHSRIYRENLKIKVNKWMANSTWEQWRKHALGLL